MDHIETAAPSGVAPRSKKTVHGDRLRKIREKAGITRNQLAQACDCSVSHIWHIETGNRQYASIELLNRFAAHLTRKSGREVDVAEFTTTEAVCACSRSA